MKKRMRELLSNRFLRFLIAGGVNAAFSYCCFAVLMYLLSIKEAAVTLNLFISIFFNYNTSARFVFRDKKMSLGQIVRFYIVYLITYPINLLHLHVTVDILGWNVYLSQFITFFYLPFISYVLQQKFVFQKQKNQGNGETT